MEEPDHEAVVAVIDAANEADGVEERYSVDELVERLEAPGCDPAVDSRLAVGPDGEIRAWGLVETVGQSGEIHRVHCAGGVHPVHRGTGLGRELLAWQVERATAVHRAVAPGAPGVAEVGVPGSSESHERLFTRFGFRVLRWWLDLGQPLGLDLPPVPDPPVGLRVVPYAEVDPEAVRRTFNTVWLDHWGARQRDEATWASEVTGASTFRPDLSTAVVTDAGEVVAFLITERFAQDDEVRGHAEAWISMLGTTREWRGRGVASALIVRALHDYRAAGLDHAMISVDADSLTGAAALYRGLGFVEEHRSASWALPLQPAPGELP